MGEGQEWPSTLKRGMVTGQGQIFNFKTPYLNLEQVKLETLNLVYGQILASPKGAWLGPGGQIFKLWDHLHIFG